MTPPPPEPEARSLGPEEVRRLQAAHAAAVKALEAAVRDTTRLTRLLTILSQGAPIAVLLDRVLSTLSELFASDVVALLRPGDGEEFTPLAAIGIPEDRLHLGLSGAPGTPLAASLLARGPVQAEDRPAHPATAAELDQLGVQTAVWLPVVGDDGVAAVLLLARCRSAPYAASDLDLLGAMAYRIAVVLERGRAELQLREALERLLQTEKLALAGKLSGSMAHELNNPLACVRSNIDQLHRHLPAIAGTYRAASRAARVLERLPGAEAAEVAQGLRTSLAGGDELLGEVEEILADSLDAARRIGQLVSSLLRLSSAERQVDPERQDLRAAVAECLADLPADTGRPALVHEAGDGAPCIAWIAPSDLKAALTGILRLVLSPGLRRTDPSRTVVIRTEHHQGRPAFSVTDPVLVLDAEELRAIFDPRLEEVDTPRGRTVRLSLMATLSYQLLRGCGADVSTVALGAQGLTVRVVLPSPPAGERGEAGGSLP